MMTVKKLLLLVPCLCMLIMNNVQGQESQKQKFKALDWLAGKWIRTNAKPGHSGYEIWDKVSDLKLIGKGVTLKGNDVTFTENLQFITKGSDIFYVVTITGEKEPVFFKLTRIDSQSFTCENPAHDFPKKITYRYDGKNIKAVISGDGKSMDYDFVRIN
ncbi:DUF6265 family protein [Pedobacter nutrimenti]|uniref:DUF6265 family protein n=1 Tax=Pedobacter nutrimenti TaxID=1241337 RepID=UPI002931069A|nr:DUF6265 family protein [Pedobacter nutrimenti]